jgi:hypothetical protein
VWWWFVRYLVGPQASDGSVAAFEFEVYPEAQVPRRLVMMRNTRRRACERADVHSDRRDYGVVGLLLRCRWD